MVLRPLRRRAGRRSRSATASPTGRCACRTGCAGTCCTCSPRRSTALRGAGRARRASASTPGASTTRCSTRAGRVLGLPFHYRDERTDGMVARAHERVPRPSSTASPASRRCRSTPSSSCSPTRGRRRWPPPTRIALVPDLLALWLSGELANERTNASTTGLLDARTRRVGARADRAARAAGAAVRRRWSSRARGSGRVLAHHELGDAPVYAVASTTPPRRSPPRRCATSTPRSSRAARGRCSGSSSTRRCSTSAPARKLTNERGVDGTIRLLKNVMGLWLEQECARVVGRRRYAELHARSPRAAPADVPLFDPDDERFLRAAATCPRGSPRRAARAARSRRDAGRDRPRRSSSRSRASTALVLERLEARHRPRRRTRPRDRRRRAQRAAVPADRRRPRPRGARRPGRGDRARQRARPGPRRRRARLARRHARGRRRLGRPDVYEPSRDGADLRALPGRDRARSTDGAP